MRTETKSYERYMLRCSLGPRHAANLRQQDLDTFVLFFNLERPTLLLVN